MHQSTQNPSSPKTTMVTIETAQATSKPKPMDIASPPRISFSSEFLDERNFITLAQSQSSSPRISFSSDILDDSNFISICPSPAADFEFRSTEETATSTMVAADQLFFEGKLLPFKKIQNPYKLDKINLREKEETVEEKKDHRVSWYIDEDPSPRPPKCTLLWTELLRLKKQRASSLSPSSSTSSSSSSSSSSDLNVQTSSLDVSKGCKESIWNRQKHVKRIKQGLEKTRSASVRIRPVVNVPVITQGKGSNVLSPLFSLKRGNVDCRGSEKLKMEGGISS